MTIFKLIFGFLQNCLVRHVARFPRSHHISHPENYYNFKLYKYYLKSYSVREIVTYTYCKSTSNKRNILFSFFDKNLP